jgi:hypothetical protein
MKIQYNTGSQDAEDDVLFFGVEPENLHSRQKSLEVLTVVLGSAFAMPTLFHGCLCKKRRKKEKIYVITCRNFSFNIQTKYKERNNKLPTNFSSSHKNELPRFFVCNGDLVCFRADARALLLP